MKKLKALVLSSVMGFSISCTPLMAIPRFTELDLRRICNYVNYQTRQGTPLRNIIRMLQPAECAAFITYQLYNVKYQQQNGAQCDIINCSLRHNRDGLLTFTESWLRHADADEINREMMYLLEDVDTFDTRYFAFRDINISEQAPNLYNHIVNVLRTIKEVHFGYYVGRVNRAINAHYQNIYRTYSPILPPDQANMEEEPFQSSFYETPEHISPDQSVLEQNNSYINVQDVDLI